MSHATGAPKEPRNDALLPVAFAVQARQQPAAAIFTLFCTSSAMVHSNGFKTVWLQTGFGSLSILNLGVSGRVLCRWYPYLPSLSKSTELETALYRATSVIHCPATMVPLSDAMEHAT